MIMRSFLMLILFIPSLLFAQDVIVKKDGSSILGKVLEVETDVLKYKKWKNLNGPVYSIKISDLFSVNYENGEKDIFSDKEFSETNKRNLDSPLFVDSNPDVRNNEVIASYNQDVFVEELNGKGKKASNLILVYGVDDKSVMSNEELEVQFERGIDTYPNDQLKEIYPFNVCYFITLKNKTNKTLYVDLGNCFKIFDDGSFNCYYNSQETTTTVGGMSGGGLALGSVASAIGIGGGVGQLLNGISVGKANNHSVSKNYVMQRVVAIPPMAKAKLTDNKYLRAKKSGGYGFGEFEKVESAEKFNYVNVGYKKGQLKRGETIYFKKNNTPYSRKYVLTYSTSEDFKEYSTMNIVVYVRQIVGSELILNVDETKKYIRGFENMKVIFGYTGLEKNYLK